MQSEKNLRRPRTQRQPQMPLANTRQDFPSLDFSPSHSFSRFFALRSLLPSKSRVLILLADSFSPLCALFGRSPRFVFNDLRTLFAKTPGGGGGSRLPVHESPATNHKPRQSLALCFPGEPSSQLCVHCAGRWSGCLKMNLLTTFKNEHL